RYPGSPRVAACRRCARRGRSAGIAAEWRPEDCGASPAARPHPTAPRAARSTAESSGASLALLQQLQMLRGTACPAAPVHRPDQREGPQGHAVIEIFPELLGAATQGRQRACELLAAADAHEPLIGERPVGDV